MTKDNGKVWVVLHEYAFEGVALEEVFNTEEDARAFADRGNVELGFAYETGQETFLVVGKSVR